MSECKTEQEMSLIEWCKKLPDSHLVNKQLKELKNDNRLIQHDVTLNLIRSMGVPETRAKSLNGSIMVLIGRMDKEIDSLNAEISRLKIL